MNTDRKHIRLHGWNYSSEGIYFITICCHEKQSYFGIINNNKMIPSEIGTIASQHWLEIPSHFPHVRLDEFVVMPNHIHGILILDYSLLSLFPHAVETRHGVSLRLQSDLTVGPCHGMALHGMSYHSKNRQNQNINEFSKPLKNSVSVIINQFKSSVKRWCNKNGNKNFRWQSRFYDHILYNENSIDSIREYIYDNPKNWMIDELFK